MKSQQVIIVNVHVQNYTLFVLAGIPFVTDVCYACLLSCPLGKELDPSMEGRSWRQCYSPINIVLDNLAGPNESAMPLEINRCWPTQVLPGKAIRQSDCCLGALPRGPIAPS